MFNRRPKTKYQLLQSPVSLLNTFSKQIYNFFYLGSSHRQGGFGGGQGVGLEGTQLRVLHQHVGRRVVHQSGIFFINNCFRNNVDPKSADNKIRPVY